MFMNFLLIHTSFHLYTPAAAEVWLIDDDDNKIIKRIMQFICLVQWLELRPALGLNYEIFTPERVEAKRRQSVFQSQ